MPPEWNRALLWSAHDARHERRKRRRSIAALSAIGAMWLGLEITAFSCQDLYFSDDDVHAPARVLFDTHECVADRDCVLLPSLVTCCGECEAAPPFEAAPRVVLDQLRHTIDTSCAPADRLCDPPICPSLPPGVDVSAVCRQGECRVEQRDGGSP